PPGETKTARRGAAGRAGASARGRVGKPAHAPTTATRRAARAADTSSPAAAWRCSCLGPHRPRLRCNVRTGSVSDATPVRLSDQTPAHKVLVSRADGVADGRRPVAQLGLRLATVGPALHAQEADGGRGEAPRHAWEEAAQDEVADLREAGHQRRG